MTVLGNLYDLFYNNNQRRCDAETVRQLLADTSLQKTYIFEGLNLKGFQ